jgi:hypothetical protein
MDAYVHARISVKHWGGRIEDYYPIHTLMDSTKELCSDNRHRILHTLWGIRRVVVPIFGAVIHNSDGQPVNVKEICEKDHILPDYQDRFIPTLSDFVQALELADRADWQAAVERFHQQYVQSRELSDLLLSPLAITGKLESLLLTHNSWFLNAIVPQVVGGTPYITDFELSPSYLFAHMRFELWMDNGSALAPSARILATTRYS